MITIFLLSLQGPVWLPRGSGKRLIRLMGLIPWVYSKQKQASEECKKPLQMGPKAFLGLFHSFPSWCHIWHPPEAFMFEISQWNCFQICLINILPDFLGLHSCQCKVVSDKFIQLECFDFFFKGNWGQSQRLNFPHPGHTLCFGLEGHIATNLSKSDSHRKKCRNSKYQALSQQTWLSLLLHPWIDILWVI